MGQIETDYLVIGAGAAGMAFADALIAASDAEVVMVDRRHGPGGHWHDAYPFVRLHGPSALYGVNSRRLGSDVIDRDGPNAGYYPRRRRPRSAPTTSRCWTSSCCPPAGSGSSACPTTARPRDGHQFTSRLTGETTTIRVRRRVVDASYLEPSIPATHVPPFGIEPGARLIPVNDLVGLSSPASGFTILGGGKTAIDACLWLLGAGVPPDAIRWVRPRDPWLLDRAFQQPLELLPRLIEGVSLYLEAAAQAEGPTDLFRRLEACGQLIRLDPGVEPTTFRCATVSQDELASLRSIENVIRLGRVTRIGPDQIKLAGGSIPADRGQVHVDCSSSRPSRQACPASLQRRPDHAAADQGLPAGLQRRLDRLHRGNARRRRAQEPDLPGKPVSRRGGRLDPAHLHRPARRDHLGHRSRRVRLDAAIPAQRHLRHRRSPAGPADGISARPPVHQHRARDQQAVGACRGGWR